MSLRVVALGGVGEFGANSLWLEGDEGDGLLLDAGAAFSDEPSLGLAYEIPDFSAISPRPPVAIVLTHAHDDHVKGLATALDAWPEVPVAASRATVNWVRSGWVNGRAPELRELSAEHPCTAGEFVIDAAPLSHSISGTLALRIRHDDATLVVATDWRLAPSALGEETATAVLERWGDEGVDLALIDSTNALVATPPPTEEVVAATLAELVQSATGAVVAVSFASHAGRFRQLALAAAEAGRQVVVAGRGLVEMLQ
ncbi:MAG: MBL fold metallo-hydrolase, partial [Acidobacteria bacterium]|nr:MBL fold metallo-hydrolase [Acidobacteriota bacterium]